ncbi:autophagy protein [Thozetella sp. PMI_491]|nr:autophagy protein [Thozetella sp. PMI_491]
MSGPGILGADAAVADLELTARLSKDLGDAKEKQASQTDIVDVSKAESLTPANDEPVTSRLELWAWYGYYFGNNSAGTLSYAPLIFQSLLSQAGFNGNDPSQDCSDSNAPCLVKFGAGNVNINSLVLICNGLIFALQGVCLLCFGSMCDYGPWRKWILWTATIVCWATQFGFLGLKNGSQFQGAVALYILSSFSYNICQAFWTPALPVLARNTPESLEIKRAYSAGEISDSQKERGLMLQRNKLSNVAFGCMSVGYTITLLIALGVAFGLHANDSDENNTKAAVVIVGVATGFWILCASPWFFFEKPRSLPLPAGESYWSVGVKSYWGILKRIGSLRHTWIYLLGYFLASDGWATTTQLFGLCQYSIVSYSTTVSTELYITQGISNAVGIAIIWLVQRHFKLATKTVVLATGAVMIILAVWGCIGIGTTAFGLHNVWEVWTWSSIACAFAAPFMACSATMLSDVIPRGKEYAFFALYALVNKSTAWIGPIISGVIIDRTGSTWTGFPFSLALTVVGIGLICCVDVEKAKKQCDAWAEREGKI